MMNDKAKKTPRPKLKAVSLDDSGKVVEIEPGSPAPPPKKKPSPKPFPRVAAKPAPAPAPDKPQPAPEGPAASSADKEPPAPAPKKKTAKNWQHKKVGPIDVRKNSLKELGRFERSPSPSGQGRRVEVHLARHRNPAIAIQGFEGERAFGFFNVRAEEVDELCRMLQEGKKMIENGEAWKAAPPEKEAAEEEPAPSGRSATGGNPIGSPERVKNC